MSSNSHKNVIDVLFYVRQISRKLSHKLQTAKNLLMQLYHYKSPCKSGKFLHKSFIKMVGCSSALINPLVSVNKIGCPMEKSSCAHYFKRNHVKLYITVKVIKYRF